MRDACRISLLLLTLLLGSCRQEIADDPLVAGEQAVTLTFTLAIGDAVALSRAEEPRHTATRATWGEYEASGEGWLGDSFDNRIRPRTLQVFLYDADNRYMGQVTHLVYAPRSEAERNVYDFTGEVDSPLTSGTYKLMVMANCEAQQGDDPDLATLAFDHQPEGIPLWGVTTVGLTLEAGRRQTLASPIYLLRSMAKVEVSVSEQVGLTLEEVRLEHFNTRGYVLPADHTAILSIDEETIGSRFHPLASPAGESVAFDAEGEDFVAYMTEKANVATGAEPARIQVRFAERPTRWYTVLFQDYTTREGFQVRRNHLYRFVISRVAADTVECNVYSYAADWDVEEEIPVSFR